RAAQEFTGTPRAGMSVEVATVASRLGSRDWRLVGARAPERFRGEKEPIDRTPGHIPGAANHFFGGNLAADNAFRTPEELRALFAPALGGTPPDHVICYCGSGVTACHNLLALEHAGIAGAALYVGSWSEWSADPARPIETGESGNRVI